ncbi:MAG: Cys-tRNA(Pro) deacylase [Eubacteriales bacterium]|nr:Cys-tRNA(Pro) deacylase [Eubacteriales bacterium]
MKKQPFNEKTNVMRLLDAAGISYNAFCYADTDAVSGTEVAAVLGEDPDRVFKTLVTVGRSKEYYVFIIPVNEELNLKKAAAVSGEKSIEMIRSKELLPLTGYIHGGCSPIGMKKQFPTFLHETAMLYDRIFFSAGKIGYQVEVSPEDLMKMIPCEYADLCG